MRSLLAIENMIPDLTKSLAFMYRDLIEESLHIVNVDKSRYYKAEVFLQAIVREVKCSPDINKLNFYLNEFNSLIENCKDVKVNPRETIILQCNRNRASITFWVADTQECEQSTFNMYATVTSFTVPDQIVDYLNGQVEIILLAESGGHKQFIQVEKSFADTNPLTGVYYFSTSLGIYLPTTKVADWTSSVITKVGVQYVQYTYTGPNRGTSKTKFVL